MDALQSLYEKQKAEMDAFEKKHRVNLLHGTPIKDDLPQMHPIKDDLVYCQA